MRHVLFLFLVFSLLGCASLSTRPPHIDEAQLKQTQIEQEDKALLRYKEMFGRLMETAYPILAQNADLCPSTRLDAGLLTHTLKDYDKTIAPAVRRVFGATDTPSILYVRPGSSTQQAGVKAGDVLLFKGRPISDRHKGWLASLEDNPTLTVQRGNETLSLNITPEPVCGYNIHLKMTPTINAYATGRSFIMTTGMMDFTQTPSELALIIGHELAHNVLSHPRKIVLNRIFTLNARRYTRPFEAEADYVGLYYMARAGYALDHVEDFWNRLAEIANPKYIATPHSHPTYPHRTLTLSLTRDEIETLQAQDKPLIPRPAKVLNN